MAGHLGFLLVNRCLLSKVECWQSGISPQSVVSLSEVENRPSGTFCHRVLSLCLKKADGHQEFRLPVCCVCLKKKPGSPALHLLETVSDWMVGQSFLFFSSESSLSLCEPRASLRAFLLRVCCFCLSWRPCCQALLISELFLCQEK